MSKKSCYVCKVELDITFFNKRTSGYYYSYCKSCSNKKVKEWLSRNGEKNKAYKKEWHKQNEKQIREYNKEYYKQNKERKKAYKEKWVEKNKGYNKEYREQNRKYLNKYQRDRRQNNIQAVLINRIRSRLCKSIKNKSIPSKSLIGCDWDFLKTYLESKFIEGMTWENRHLWHIDHIRPLSSFDLTDVEQQKQACHYTNLQPLWASDNLRKSDKWEA